MQRILRIKQSRSISQVIVIQSWQRFWVALHARCFAARCMTGIYRYFGTSLIVRRHYLELRQRPNFPTQPNNVSVTYATPDHYPVRGDAITVLGLPRAALSPDQTVCADTTTTLTVAGTPPGATYNWSPTTGLNTNIEPMVTATPDGHHLHRARDHGRWLHGQCHRYGYATGCAHYFTARFAPAANCGPAGSFYCYHPQCMTR